MALDAGHKGLHLGAVRAQLAPQGRHHGGVEALQGRLQLKQQGGGDAHAGSGQGQCLVQGVIGLGQRLLVADRQRSGQVRLSRGCQEHAAEGGPRGGRRAQGQLSQQAAAAAAAVGCWAGGGGSAHAQAERHHQEEQRGAAQGHDVRKLRLQEGVHTGGCDRRGRAGPFHPPLPNALKSWEAGKRA